MTMDVNKIKMAVRRLTEDPFYIMMNKSPAARRWMVNKAPWTPRKLAQLNNCKTILEHYQESPNVTLFYLRHWKAPKIMQKIWIDTQQVDLNAPILNLDKDDKNDQRVDEIPWNQLSRLRNDPFYIMMNTSWRARRWMARHLPWTPPNRWFQATNGKTFLQYFEDMGRKKALRYFRRRKAPVEIIRSWKMSHPPGSDPPAVDPTAFLYFY